LPLKRRFENSPDIDFRFYLSKNWSSISYLPKPDNLLTPITLNITLSADYKAKDIPLNLGTSLRYRDGNSILLNSTKREVTHAQKDLDIYAGWKFANKAQLKLSIDNLLMPVKQTQAYYFDLDSTTIQNNRNRSYRSLNLKYETTL
jgi:outer membrane receptor for ferrienterochelin and colicins